MTSLALLLGAGWPAEFGVERVVLEADAAGGVLGARYGLGVDPGAVSLLTALRRSSVAPIEVGAHARSLAGGLWIVPCPETGTQARAIWSAELGKSLTRLATDGRVWIVDVGRFGDADTAARFLDDSELGIVVSGPHVEDLVQVPDRVELLRARSRRVGVIVTGRTPHSDDELARFSRADMVWRTAAATDLFAEAGQALFGRRGRRSWVWRQALEVAAGVAGIVSGTDAPAERVRRQGVHS